MSEALVFVFEHFVAGDVVTSAVVDVSWLVGEVLAWPVVGLCAVLVLVGGVVGVCGVGVFGLGVVGVVGGLVVLAGCGRTVVGGVVFDVDGFEDFCGCVGSIVGVLWGGVVGVWGGGVVCGGGYGGFVFVVVWGVVHGVFSLVSVS